MASTWHSGRDVVQSLERGLLVLRAFSRERRPLSVAEIAESVELSRPTVRRMLLTLEYLGYTTQTGSTWTLTPRVLEIGSGYFIESSLPEISQPFLHELADSIAETCTVSVFDRGDVVQVARAEVHRIVPDTIRVGTRLPAYATALGTVLLGALSDAELDDYLDAGGFSSITPQTMTDPARIRDRAIEARERGYALSVEELEAGVISLAVPIQIETATFAAMGMTSSTARKTQDDLVAIVSVLRTAADEVARVYQLGNPYGRLPRGVHEGLSRVGGGPTWSTRPAFLPSSPA
ncbi:IclR family transcriptional regulator C-terminal domain-containing protein [Microbacterium sp. 18062]|uniref:IclR family transcriptional regulator domain-containing protein n=1 Tax=Microbacterium sp. 18062 TaxID=2681410 RepID=UPI00135B9FDF|nr:IclR family transcriptional regulator C-terminal domain-containing protein [Microbacterium sp. 18062]